MTNHFTFSQHDITKPVMYQIEISGLIYLNGSQLENWNHNFMLTGNDGSVTKVTNYRFEIPAFI